MAVLSAEIFTQILLETRPRAELWDWLITFVATGLSALLALGLFGYQSWQTERDRQNQLLAALAGELQSNLDIIRSEHRTPFISRGTKPGSYFKYADAKLIRLDPIVLVETIRSGVFDAADVYRLTRIVRELQVHNDDIGYLLSLRSAPSTNNDANAIVLATKELDQRQALIESMCQDLLDFMVLEGIRVPTPPGEEGSNGGSPE